VDNRPQLRKSGGRPRPALVSERGGCALEFHAILDDEKVVETMGTVDWFCDWLLLALLVAAITLAFLDNCGCLGALVGRQGATYIIAFFELAALASTDEPFVAFVRLDQFAWHHTLLSE
jgi:hypothetical protein